MKKRGQVSVFIIIAIVLIAIIAMGFYIAKSYQQEIIKTSIWSKFGFKSEADVIKNALSECMKTNTKDALKTIGIQGGYYKKPAKYSDLGWTFIPFYYLQGEYLMPDKSLIETELSDFTDDKMNECIKQIEFKNLDFSYDKTKTITSIQKGKVTFKIDLSVTIKKQDTITKIELKDHPVMYNSSLYDIIEVSDFIIKSHKDNETMICINCVVEMAKERSLFVDMLNYPKSEDTVLVMISENYTSQGPYLFEFLEGY